MKKPTFSKFIIFISLFLMNFASFAQNDKAFGVRFDKDVQGDMLLIGNNILSQDNNDYNNDAEYNSNIDMKYIDIDNDATTFSSSSANLTIPNKGCVKILYAGLYWSAILQDGDRSTINTVKFKSPTGGYNNITGQVIWDADAKPVGGNKPYVCYADVTNLMDLTNPNGKYTVANVVSSLGLNGGTGLSAGWSLYIVYEDLTLTSKSITSFDGFSGITKNTGTLDINISGFRTIPVGPVRAKIAFAALEGDKPITGDYLQINGSAMSTTERPVDNFFNSTVTDLNGLYIDRIPASSNTLGYDAGIMKVNNPATKKYPGGSVIKNDDQSATITLGSTGDTYFFYFTSFAVDIIAPKIVLTKVVQDNSGKDIGNTNVTLGDQLNYVIGFQNVGNDNAKSLTIRDVLPINIIFNYPADLMPLPAGVTVKSYNAATREIIFDVNNSVVEVGDTALEIRFKVKVVPSCNMLSDACSNSIDNIAYATYKGTLNPDFVLTDDPSANTNTGCLLVKKATNFLVGIDNCKFTKSEILCGATVTLKAANGYSSYSWSSSPTGTPVLGTNQTLTVSKVGTYYVHDTAIAPCLSIDEVVTVTSFGGVANNPVIPFADQVVVCTSDGKKLPNIFLCGATATKLIQTNISDGSTIVWEKLNESGACPAATSSTICANESTTCTWTQVATGPDYLANTSGQFRVTFTYPGACFNRFYFNVFQNLLNPTATSIDKFCNTPAKITVGGVGAGYEYSLDGITYQSSNIFPNASFPVVTAGTHTVYIRQIGVANGCVFEVKGIQILDKVLKVTPTKVVQPLCFGYKGSIKVGVNDVKAQYTYTLYKNGAFVSSSGLTNALDYEFLNLDGGTTTPLAPITYRIDVTTDNGCTDTVTVDLIMPDLVTATASLTKPFTCNDGEITVNVVGGTKPYFYYVNSPTVFQTVPQIVVTNPLPAGGLYNIDVVDDNGCRANTSIPVANIPMPVYTIASTNVKCYGDNTGTIQFNVTSANGYTLMYSIDNGITYSASNVFTNLVANTVYTPKIKYSLGGVDCFDTKPAITLTGPAAALTASAGVSELAGCGPGGAGKIRITNAQGGTPFPVPNPYLYSFDNQNSWSLINEAYLPVGTHTVYIKDASGCIFPMSDITIDPLPVAPVIDKVDVVYSCDGTAKSTVTVTKPASANYDYTYSIDGTLNTPPSSNVFVGVPAGNHIIKVGYVLTSATTFSNLLNEDFGRGAPTTTPGIASAYCFNDQHVSPPYFCPNPTRSVEDNQYSVTSFFWRSDDPSSTNVGAWYHFKDHTVFTPAVNDGRYLLVNIGSAAGNYGVLYSKPIIDVIPNQPVKVDLYLGNLLRNTISAVNPDFIIELVNASGTVVASQATGVIPNNELWNLKSLSLNPGPNTSLTFKIRSGSIAYGGNDAVIDDIRVYQLPKACIDYKDIPLVIASNKKFDATITGTSDISCAGLSDGTITINAVNFDPIAGFEYSIDGNNPWLKSTNPTVIITGLAAGTYTPQVRYNGAGDCKFPLTPTKIIAPAPIVVKTTQTVATCQAGATVDATTTTGGTPAYSFQLIDTAAPFTVTNFPNTGILNNVPPGTYVVKVTDAKGCTANKASNLVIAAPVNPTASIVQNTGLCFDPTSGANITVNVGGGVGPYTYKTIFNGGTASASSPTFAGPTFTYNATVTGTYSFEVYDSYGCKATTADQIINAKLTAAAAVTTALDCDVAPASPDAVIKVTITDGNAPYKYKVKKGLGAYGVSTLVIGSAFNNQVTPANADTYTYEITDNLGCVTTTTVTVNPLVPVTGSVTKKDDPTCFNGTDGQVQLAGGGGSGVYKFSFNGSGFTSTSLYTALDAKTTTATTTVYSYQVQDSNGCVSPIYTVTLNNPTAVVASATIPVNNTCSTTTIITTAGAGGAGGYSYSFNGSSTYTSVNTLSVTLSAVAQTITYSVKDSKGCIDTRTINIPAYNPPTGINFSTPAVITCLAMNTSVTLTPVAGVAPFTYLITAGPGTATSNVSGASTGNFTGLISGNYTFQVTDANGCKASASLPIAPAAVIAVSGSKTDVKCFGASDGTATFTVTGASAVGNYTYTLSPASGSVNKTGNVVTVTGLGTGTYDLVVKDITTGCTSNTASVTINPATAITFTVASTKVNCNNKISTISFPTLSGGTPGYTYAFVTAGAVAPGAGAYSASTTVDTALLGLSIDVYVKDNNGCIAPKQTISIGQENVPTINTPATQCYVGTPIAITITGTTVGTPSYSIDNVTYGSSPNFNLGVGSYTLYIKDGFGCPASTPYVVAPQLTISAIAAVDATCTPNTTINLTATGGTGAYTYQVSSNGGTTYGPSTNPYVTATAGTYTFKVTDAATPACSVVSTDVIVKTKATVLTLTTTKTDVKCKGDATGIINISPTSGVAPYTYSVTKGGLPVSTTATTTGLVAGTYDIVVTDALGCNSASTPVIIGEPAIALSASATAPPTTTCGSSTTVTVTGAGGTGVYTYSINGSGFSSLNTLVINDNGSDQVIFYQVRDANGCTTVSQNITVKALNPPKITGITGTPIYCLPVANNTSTVTVTTSNGLAPLAFVIVSGPTVNTTGAINGKFTGLTSGTYLFKVTDANGCSDTKSYTVDPVTPIDIKGQNISNVLCNGGSTGIAKYTVSGFSATGNYTIAVTTVPAALPFTQTQIGDVITLSDLGVGSYTVTVKDNTTGCSKSDVVSIIQPPVLTLVLASNVNANCYVTTSKVSVTAGGGTPGYTYAFKLDGVAPIASDYGTLFTANLNPTTSLLWDVWVKDAKGCETKLDVTIAKDPMPTVTASVQNQCTATGSSFVIKAVGAGGVGAYTYTINTGVAPTGPLADTFTVAPGTYTITVQDANGCPNNTSVTVNAVLNASASLTKDLTCPIGSTVATIAINANGGKLGYSYKVSFNGGLFTAPIAPATIVGNLFTTDVAGTYKFEVTDSNLPTACTVVTNDVIVTTPVAVTASSKFVGPGCNGNTNGSIELKALTGEAPFTYSITGVVGLSSANIFTDLAANTYSYIVRDKKGCDATGTIILDNPLPIAVTITPNAIKCNSNIPGSIDVSVDTGGVGPFVYTLYNNASTQMATSGPISGTAYNFGGLSFGDYYVTVVDSKGCEYKSVKTRINTIPQINFTGLAAGGTCAAGATVTIDVISGASPFTYSIYGQPATSFGPTPLMSHTFTGLDHGVTYQFQVIDAGGCYSIIDVTTPTLSGINVDATVKSNVTCYGSNEGTLDFTVKNYGATKIFYEVRDELTNMPLPTPINGTLSGLSGADANFSTLMGGAFLTGLKSGNYTLFVKEMDGTECTAVKLFQITQPLPVNGMITFETNANSCNSGTQVRIAATGGTAPYKYAFVLDGAPHAGAYTTSSLGTLNPFPLPLKLDWDIWVKDANDCEFKLDHTITVDPSPVIDLALVDKCAAEGAFAINVTETTAGVGAYSISVNGSTFSSIPGLPYTVTGLNSGLNTIIVKDANGCTDTKTVTIDKPLEMTPAITSPSCNNVITLTGTGGTGSYTYSISPMPLGVTVAGNVISNVPAGVYIVTMTDTAIPSACSITTSVTLTTPTPVTFNAVTTPVSCMGSSDGIITVNLPATNDNPVYTYTISPVPPGSVQVDNVFSKLPAGTYTVTVTSGKGCSLSDTNVIVGTPLALFATAAIKDYACNATNIPQPAKVTVNVTAGTGTGPYKYNFDGLTNYYDTNELYVVDNGLPQTVKFYVKDANGCLFNDQVIVSPYKKITDITFVGSAPTCPIPTSDVKLTVVGGYAIAKYEILSPAPFDNGVSDTFLGLAPDVTYLFKVTDVNGCSFQKSYTTKKLTSIAIVGELVNDISCNVLNGTTNNGTAKYTVTGFSASTNYSISVTTVPAALPYTQTQVGDVITLSNLSAGSYNVAVTDLTTGCTQNTTVATTTPVAIAFTATATKVFCSKDISEITVSGVIGGTGAYTYAVEKTGDPALEVYTSNNIFSVDTNLTDLSWDVYVKDANGCVAKITTPVVYNLPPTIIVPTQQCFTGTNLTVNLNGWTNVYGGVKSYTLDGSDLASSIATFTAPGTYKLGIKDDNGCEAFVNYTIQKQLLAVATITKGLYCAAPINATIKVDITDGLGPYSYQMYLGGAAVGGSTPVVGNNFTVSVATAGDYTFEITDTNSPACNVTTTKVTVNPPVPTVIVSTPITQAILCNGGTATMQVNIDASIGLSPYTYSVTRTLPTVLPAVVQLSNNVFTGLTAGTYDIIVTDAKGCVSATASKVIGEPVVLTATHSYPVNTTCSIATVITVVGHDGTPTGSGTGYYYNFNNEGYTTTNTYTVNDNGAIQNISYTVKDANGCETAPKMVTVNPLSKPTDLTFNASPIYCVAPNLTSTVDVTATKGVGTLTFNIIGTNTATAPALWGPITTAGFATPASFPGLLPGDYTFQITDSNGCSYEELYTVKDVVKITANGQLVAGVACKGDANGKVTFTVSGFSAGGFTKTITGVSGAGVITPVGTDTFELTSLVTGNYKIDVTDNTTGCVSTFTVFVPEPIVLGVSYITVKNANCKVGTTIKATANDGTPGYTYAFVKAGDPKVYSNSDTAVLDPAFSWVVWAKDAHGCEVSTPTPITIITDPMPTVTATVASQCANPAGYTINVVGTGVGILEYSLDGNSFQTATSFVVSSPGSYTVIVRDGNKCTASATLPVIILKPLALKGDVTKFRSCGAVNDGEITLTATDGSGSYEYSNGVGAYGASNVFSGLAAGTYTMNVRDKITPLCVKSVQVIIDAPTLVTVKSVKAIDVSCMGSSDGSITVTLEPSTLLVNNNPDYDYSLVRNPLPAGTPVTILNQKSNIFDNLEAGSYTVTTTSSRDCKDIQTISVGSPGAIVVPAPVVVEYACSTATPSNAMNLATITVNAPSGGSGTFTTYEFIKAGAIVQSGKSNVYTQTDLSGGTFTINVYDDKHCPGTTVATIKPFVSIDFAAAAINVTKAFTCVNDEEIRVNVTRTGTIVPMPTLIYNVKGLSTGSVYNVTDPVPTGVFKGLTVGDYMVTVINPDTGCAIQTIHYVNDPNTFDLRVKSKSDVVCFGSNEGSVELFLVDLIPLPTDESGPYSYIIKDAAGVIVQSGISTNAAPKLITGLKAGTYSVTATLTSLTSPQCTTADKYFTINQPVEALVISETHTRITCASNNNGTISATAVGGWSGGYMYQLELGGTAIKGWNTVSNFTDLGAGNYTVRVKDSKGCEKVVLVTLSIPTPIAFVATPSTALLTCFGDTNASISVSAPTGGQGSNYLYTLNTTSVTPNTFSGPQASPIFANLGAGTYTVTVTDGFSCSTTSAPLVIAQPSIVKPSLVVSSTQTCTVQTSLTLSATGGTGQYTYSTDGITYLPTPFASSVTFAVPTGTYHYYVKDANGCTGIVSNDITIDPLVPLTIKLDVTNAVINCRGDNTGVIVATANGGLGNYVYTLLDDATNNPIAGAVQTTPGYFTKLAAGSYKVKVVSRDCNTTTATITITQPNLPLVAPFTVTPVTCNGNGDGKVVINASGGTGIIKYAISPNLDQFFESNTFNKLKPKNYDVIVQDVLGCYVPLNFTITEPNPIDVITVANSIIPEICVGDKNGAFKINVSGGVAPYSVDLDKQNAGNTTKGAIGQTQFDFTKGITGGDHMVYITDMNGCTAEWKVSLPRAINLDPKAVVTYECDVNTPGNKVTVSVDPSNTVASDIDYTIDGVTPFQASNVFANVAAGLHFVEARHTNGCIQKFNGITVDKLDPLSLSLDLGGLNEIVATISGGSGIYQLTINGEPMTAQNKFIYFRSGDYTVTLTDSNGCMVSAIKHFDFIDIKIPPIFTPTGDGTNETWKPTNTENYPDIKFIVYDRYGREVGVFGAGQSWDGKYNGTELPMGDYWYVLKLRHSQDDREFIGHFTLYR